MNDTENPDNEVPTEEAVEVAARRIGKRALLIGATVFGFLSVGLAIAKILAPEDKLVVVEVVVAEKDEDSEDPAAEPAV